MCILLFTALVGCGMRTNNTTITKEQQNNITKRILRNYDLTSIEFTEFSQDKKIGSYLLSIKINKKEELQTTIFFRDIDRLNNSTDEIGLNSIDNFQELRRRIPLTENDMSLEDIEVIYLGD